MLFPSRIPGSRWAYEQAKSNLINKYLLVGVTEQLEEFVAVLEATLPMYFKGALSLYRKGIVYYQFPDH